MNCDVLFECRYLITVDIFHYFVLESYCHKIFGLYRLLPISESSPVSAIEKIGTYRGSKYCPCDTKDFNAFISTITSNRMDQLPSTYASHIFCACQPSPRNTDRLHEAENHKLEPSDPLFVTLRRFLL
jgi:hypothetical protein